MDYTVVVVDWNRHKSARGVPSIIWHFIDHGNVRLDFVSLVSDFYFSAIIRCDFIDRKVDFHSFDRTIFSPGSIIESAGSWGLSARRVETKFLWWTWTDSYWLLHNLIGLKEKENSNLEKHGNIFSYNSISKTTEEILYFEKIHKKIYITIYIRYIYTLSL